MSNFKPRTSAPSTTDKNWYSNKNIFFASSCGSAATAEAKANGEVRTNLGLPNCTCYAYGRWLELGVAVKNLMGDADKWIANNTEYRVSCIPALGAIACYDKGSGSGHVTVVEKIYDNGDCLLSESIYNRTPSKGIVFQCKTRVTKASGWKYYDKPLLGFIINPNYLLVEGYLDSQSYNSSNGKITVSGWCYIGNEEAKVVIKVDGKEVGTLTTSKLRDDVKKVRGYDTNKVGFAGTVAGVKTSGKHTVTAEVDDVELSLNPNYDNTYTVSSSGNSHSIYAGKIIKLSNAKVYKKAADKTPYATRSGTYYIWSDEVVDGKIRMTNSKTRVGVKGQVSFWLPIEYIG